MRVSKVLEASYGGGAGKGSIAWFLNTFFALDEVEQITDYTVESRWYIKDGFLATGAEYDDHQILGIFGRYDGDHTASNEKVKWRPGINTEWYAYLGPTGDYSVDEIDDPRKIIILKTEKIWSPNNINEAAHIGHTKPGTIEWLIKNFFDYDYEQESETGPIIDYEVKDGILILDRDEYNVVGVRTWKTPEGDLDFDLTRKDRGTRSVRSSYTPIDKLRIFQMKQLWGPGMQKAESRRDYEARHPYGYGSSN